MNDTLILEGKKYISSQRAAEIAGYSNDYIGQLCRSGRLLGRIVGRFWYVNEDSIRDYKIEGKKFISSRKAAEIAGYSNDYVGQLCRSGKLVCRMVGRTWYVNEDSLTKHKLESAKPNQTVFKKAGAMADSPTEDLPKRQWDEPSGSVNAVQKASLIRSPYALLAPTAAAILLLLVMAATGNLRFHSSSSESVSSTGGASVASASSAVRSAEQALAFIWNGLASETESLISRFRPASSAPVEVAEEPSASSVVPSRDIGKMTAEHGGMVVFPALSSSTDEAKLVSTIQNSFSDTVVVRPDQSGTAGVIQPVFRSSAGHDFLYVLVPVKATSTAAVN